MTDVHDRFRSLDRVRVPDLWGEATLRAVAEPLNAPQSRSNYLLPVGLATAAIVIVLIVGLGLLWGPTIGTPDATPTPEATPGSTSSSPDPSASIPLIQRMPGSRSNPAGVYGWTGALGSSTGMHNVVGLDDGGGRMTQMVFAVEDDCFASGDGPEPVPVTVGGLDGTYVEPYDGPGVLFMPEREEGQTTGAYALAIDGRTLCVYLTWDPSTTADELDAARQVVESIRGEALGSGLRIIFTLPQGWDTG